MATNRKQLGIQQNQMSTSAGRHSLVPMYQPSRRRLGCAALAFGAGALLLPDAAAAADFRTWLEEVRVEAGRLGVRAEILDQAFANLQPLARVLELDRRQPETTITFAQYLDRVVTPERVAQGRWHLDKNRTLLEKVASIYAVQPEIIVSLWGIESNFGQNTGGFKVIESLATLAFDGRRSQFFRTEMFNALRILEGGHISFPSMLGSWAGAMGQNQFMPSSFLTYAVDFDGDGRRDIWSSRADVFASSANYLVRNGWKYRDPWGYPVTISRDVAVEESGLDRKRPISEWLERGVRLTRVEDESQIDKSRLSSLLFPDRVSGQAFLVNDNFHVILRWNRSNYFASSVGILADRVIS